MKLLPLAAVLYCVVGLGACAKLLVMVPALSGSNAIFDARIAQLLMEAGHDVHLYAPIYDPKVDIHKFAHPNVTVHRFEAVNMAELDAVHRAQANMMFDEFSVLDAELYEVFDMFAAMLAHVCEAQVTNKEVMDRLKAEKFDLAFAHMYDMCPFGIIHMLGIPTTIWMSSSVLVEQMALLGGVPTPPSFVPTTMSDFSDHMTFWQRMQNFLGLSIFTPFFIGLMNDQTEIFRKHVDPSFPELTTLASEKSQLLFVNSIELLDFPRPILHKVIYIGGIGMKDPKPLEEAWLSMVPNGRVLQKWSSVVDASSGVVLVSFGSVAPANSMPQHWKEAIVGLARSMPQYTFIWKYETPDDLGWSTWSEAQVGKIPSNMHPSPWVPQTDLLGHPKVIAFITHGGYNSLLESALAGKPILAVPLFGDQYRNARVSERHGYGKMVQKRDMSAQTLQDGISTLVNDKTLVFRLYDDVRTSWKESISWRYSSNAQRLSKMLRKRPIKSEDLVVSWTEFLAEFKELPNLDAASRTMSAVAYNNIDVIAVLLAGVLFVLYIIIKILKFILGLCCGGGKKQKRD